MMPLNTLGRNLAALVLAAADHHPDKPAFIHREGVLTYGELAGRIRRLAGALRERGLSPGGRAGILLYNQPEFVIAYFALLGLGVTVLPLNTRLTAGELGVILSDAGAEWLFSSSDFAEVLKELTVPSLKRLVLEEPGHGARGLETVTYDALFSEDVALDVDFPVVPEPRTVATLIYTSGTTGKPKGVMLSHGNILADATANAAVIEAMEADRFITISPLFHVFGQTNILITAMLSRSTVVLVKKFSPRTVLEAVEEHRVTFMAAVPTMYQMMLAHIEERPFDLSSLRVCHSGAAPMAKEVFHRIEKAFGAPVQEGYGLSEASSIVCSNPLRGVRKPGSVGLPLPGVTVEIFSEEAERFGQPLPPGEVGELHVRGDIVMLGYHNRPEATARTLVDGWLKTRDMGFKDEDGYLHIVDRKDDLMNIGGVKVYPREIEEVLYRHPAVHAVAVVGVPSELYHEEIKAYVVPRSGAALDKSEMRRFCREFLAEFKTPTHWEFVSEIPQGATGKILRKDLRRASSQSI